jgi:hypothetical protein
MPSFRPYAEEPANSIYTLLFCDDLDPYRHNPTPPRGYPWDALFAEEDDVAALQEIVSDRQLEARLKLLAYQRLRAANQPIENRELLAVVVEVGLDDGLDVIAAYADGTARYINQSGKMIFWESPEAESRALIQQLYTASVNIVSKIGAWDGERLPPPERGQLRLSFLVSDGLYFGQGPVEVLFGDALAGPALQAALALVQFLTEKTSR